MTDKVIMRGYVRWTDDDGVYHKEPLVDHPEMLAEASPAEQLAAEEARRLNTAAEDYYAEVEARDEDTTEEVLAALKSAPEEVLTAGDLPEDTAGPAPRDEDLTHTSADGGTSPEVDVMKAEATDEDAHNRALEELREKTAE